MEEKIHFEVTSSLGKRIRVTKAYWNKIIEIKHALMKGKEDLVKDTLKNAEQVRSSKKDPNVYLYYKAADKHHCCVVVRHENEHGFVITTYITDRIKVGEKV